MKVHIKINYAQKFINLERFLSLILILNLTSILFYQAIFKYIKNSYIFIGIPFQQSNSKLKSQ